jgi:tetratricopeptide (TPR) repeat protein
MNDSLRYRVAAAAGTAATAFIIYLSTLAPSLDFIDAGELAAVAHTFGIAHPTGYPLFTMLAGIWSWLPIGDGVYRLNVFSAFCSAVGVAFFVDAIWHFLGLRPRKMKGSKKGVHHVEGDYERIVIAIIGGLAIALSRTYWRTALSIEVYTLHMLMLGLIFWAASRLLLAMHDDALRSRIPRRLLLLALFCGLSFSNHMSTIFLAPGLLLLPVVLLRKKILKATKLLPAAAAFAAGLLPYVYLPLRAASDPWLNWGNPVTWERIIWHVTGKQYSVWMFSGADAWRQQFSVVTAMIPVDVQYLALVAALAGMIALFRRNVLLGSMLLLFFVTCLLWAAGYDIHDIDAYMLLAFVTLAVWTAMGAAVITRWIAGRISLPLRRPILLGFVFVLPMFGNGGAVSQRGNYLVEDYTRNMFASLEKNALILSFQWDYWVSASLYYQAVENFRTDVIVLDKELFRRSWYLEQTRVNYPELYERSHAEIEAFEIELEKFERNLPYDPNAIEVAFNRLNNSFIDYNYAERPIYVTIEMEEQFAPDYIRVPVGLAFRLYRPEDLPPVEKLPFPELSYRPFQSNDRLPTGLHGMYASMLMNRAVYLHRAGAFADAVPFFLRARDFAPDDHRIRQWEQRNEEAMRANPGWHTPENQGNVQRDIDTE